MQISRSDTRPHIQWAVSLVILHMVTSIFLQGLCGYIWVNILTLSPQRVAYVVKGYPKRFWSINCLRLSQCVLRQNVLNGHCLKFCGPDSYNPCNSCWNNCCYIIMRLSVVCPSRIGCRSVWLKGTPNGSGLLPSPQPVYAAAKIFKWQSYQINNFQVRKKTKEIVCPLICSPYSVIM